MKWLRLAFSVLLFPLSLAWYRKDVGPDGIAPLAYWLLMGLWVAANVVATVIALRSMSFEVPLDF